MSKIHRLPCNPHKQDWVDFAGGLDITSPQIKIPPGYCRASQNFEEDILGGYSTVVGYERYSGEASPSAGIFYLLNYTGALGGVTVGATITGATSGSTGYVIAINPGVLILVGVTGSWLINESLLTYGTSIVGPINNGVVMDDTTANYQYQAAQFYRALILPVGGSLCSGSVLGVWYYKGIVYAFRNLVAGGVGLFASSSAGWLQVGLGYEIYYMAGSGSVPAIGTTIIKGGASAVIAQITVEGGTFAAGTATGRFIVAAITGIFTAGAFTSGVSATCVEQNAIILPEQNGRFEFVTNNFYGLSTSSKMYGADGVNRGFEFDGTTFVPINTGMGHTPINTGAPIGGDNPLHVCVYQEYLFYSFYGSVMFSGVGSPYNWTAINGAVEIGLGDTVTGFVLQPGNESSPALAIYCRNHTYMLYGSSATTWNLVNYNATAGCIAYSAQKIGGHTYVFDDRGVTSLETSLIYGNFLESTISQRVKPLLAAKRNQFVDSNVMLDKQQYRLFFNDGYGLYITMGTDANGKPSASFMPVQFADVMTCSCAMEFDSGLPNGGGANVAFFGTTSGYVMQMEMGTSFDGQPISAYMDLVYNNEKAYRELKRFRRLTMEMIGTGYAGFNVSYDLNYASTDYGQAGYTAESVNLSSSNWDSGLIWDSNITWDGTPITSMTMAIDGDGMNIAVKLSYNSNYYATVKFSGVLIEYSTGRMLR